MTARFFDRFINDVTTVPEAAPDLGDGIPPYPREAFAPKQKRLYPEVQPLALAASADAAFAAITAAAGTMTGWTVEAADAKARRLRAVARTSGLGFKDDIVVVVFPQGSGSVVQMRSRSRVGKGDFGANAQRIVAFLEAVRRAAK